MIGGVDTLISSLQNFNFESVEVGDEDYDGVLLAENVNKGLWNQLLESDNTYTKLLWYDAGESKVYVIETPSQPHEVAAEEIGDQIKILKPDVFSCKSNRWIGGDQVGREADASFRPTQGVSPPPMGILLKDYVTVIVEVGYAQGFGGARGLRAKANMWLAHYPSVMYILLVHISKKLNSLKAELWQRNAANPTQTRNFSHPGAQPLVLSSHTILNLLPNTVLPHGHPATIQINFDLVRNAIKETEPHA